MNKARFVFSSLIPFRGYSCDGQYEEVPPERGSFFGFQVYERVEKSVISVSRRDQKGSQQELKLRCIL